MEKVIVTSTMLCGNALFPHHISKKLIEGKINLSTLQRDMFNFFFPQEIKQNNYTLEKTLSRAFNDTCLIVIGYIKLKKEPTNRSVRSNMFVVYSLIITSLP
jgi:hypothetical protein